jgi:hypothetical protein
MFHLNFPDASFDVIWAEGSIYIIGFENGLKYSEYYGYVFYIMQNN